MRSSTGSNRATNKAIVRQISRAASSRIIEQLESRQMMAANPYDVRRVPAFTPTSANVADVKNGPLAKGGDSLISVFKEFTKYIKHGGVRSAFKSALADQYVISGGNVGLTIRTSGTIEALTAQVKALGGSIIYRSKQRHVVEASLPIGQADNLVANANVLNARPMVRATTHSTGVVANLAERALKSEDLLPAYGVDGTGQTIGVISDSFDSGYVEPPLVPRSSLGSASDDVDNGDLSTVNVLNDQNGTNEGRAMLQLAHDIAPGAGLAFAAVGDSQLTFASAITRLREEANSTVIVDDIGFSTEPYFQPGVIDKAINDVTDDGVSYLSAAGNEGGAGYQRHAEYVRDPDVAGGYEVDFDPSSKVATELNITIKRPGNLFFQWDDVYDGVVANVQSDLDFYLYRKGTLIARSVDNNFATGVPVEAIDVTDPGDYQIVIKVNSIAKDGKLPTLYKFAADGNNDGMFDARTGIDFTDATSTSAVSGHAHAAGNIPVGAVDYSDTNPLAGARTIPNEKYSSAGSVLETYDANGNRYSEPQTVRGVLFSSVDATATNVSGYVVGGGGFEFADFRTFRGTSAAAPNAAAVVALLRQLSPNAGPEDIRDALVASAKGNPLNGSARGELDLQGGYGLIDAARAANILDPTVAASQISAPATVTGGSLSTIQVDFTKPVTGVDIDDFILTRDGTSTNRFSGSETIVASNNNKTYTITNLQIATNVLGVYTLQLRPGRTDIVDANNEPAAGNILSFEVTLNKVSGLIADTLDDGKIRLRWSDTNNREDGYRIQRSTSPDFSSVQNIDLPANAKTYTDSEVLPGEVYYYRIRAAKNSRFGEVSRISAVASSAGEIFVDDSKAKYKGTWSTSGDTAAFLQSQHRASATDLLDTTPNTATFASEDIATGSYFVYARYTPSTKSATNATYQILQNGKLLQNVTINQRTRGNAWVLLGKFASLTSAGLSVRLTSAGANGPVAADAIRFLPADEATIAAFEKQKAAKSST